MTEISEKLETSCLTLYEYRLQKRPQKQKKLAGNTGLGVLRKFTWSPSLRLAQSLRNKHFHRLGHRSGTFLSAIGPRFFDILRAHPQVEEGRKQAKKNSYNPSKSRNPWRPDTLEYAAWNYGWNSSTPEGYEFSCKP